MKNADEIRNTVQRGQTGKGGLRNGHRKPVSDSVPRLFAPREVVLLEQFLRELRSATIHPMAKTPSSFVPSGSIIDVVARHRSELPELHAFVRGMIYGL